MAFLDYTGLGHFLDKLKTIFPLLSSKGAANGIASLDASSKVPAAQLPVMVGATSSSAGESGVVPPSSAGDQNKYLKADGTWGEVDASGKVDTQQSVSDAGKVLGIGDDGIVTPFSYGTVTQDLTIATTDWSAASPYTYVYTNSIVTLDSKVEIYPRDGAELAQIEKFNYTISAGSITFTTVELPVAALPITINITYGNAGSSNVVYVTATASGWSNSTQTLTVQGVTATSNIMVGPGNCTDAQYEAICNASIRCVAQGTDSITLKCSDTPSIDLPISVCIL